LSEAEMTNRLRSGRVVNHVATWICAVLKITGSMYTLGVVSFGLYLVKLTLFLIVFDKKQCFA
jgi:hypothetical protein